MDEENMSQSLIILAYKASLEGYMDSCFRVSKNNRVEIEPRDAASANHRKEKISATRSSAKASMSRSLRRKK
jgi:hypothetical protein